jgi:Arc/MetJ-type ribon-helix-helix transcriptional regulator
MTDGDATDDEMTQVTVRVPDPMLAAIDRLVGVGEYPNRSECVRAGIRREFRDAGVERGNRRPDRSGETLIGDGGWDPEPAELREGETRDDGGSHAQQLTEAQRALVEDGGEDGGGGGDGGDGGPTWFVEPEQVVEWFDYGEVDVR